MAVRAFRGDKELPALQKRGEEMAGNVETMNNVEGPGVSFTTAKMMGGMWQFLSCGFGKKIVMVGERSIFCNSSGAKPWHKSWEWRKFRRCRSVGF